MTNELGFSHTSRRRGLCFMGHTRSGTKRAKEQKLAKKTPLKSQVCTKKKGPQLHNHTHRVVSLGAELRQNAKL